MSDLTWTVHYNITKQDIQDVLEVYGMEDNPAITLAHAIMDLPDDDKLPAALDQLTELTNKLDDWIEEGDVCYECDEGVENLMRELETLVYDGVVIDPHTSQRMRLLLEELNALFANYDLEPLRVIIDALKQELQEADH